MEYVPGVLLPGATCDPDLGIDPEHSSKVSDVLDSFFNHYFLLVFQLFSFHVLITKMTGKNYPYLEKNLVVIA